MALICEAPVTKGPQKGLTATGTWAGRQRHYKANEAPCDACREAAAAHNAQWHATNTARAATRWKRYYRENSDTIKARIRDHQQVHREEVRLAKRLKREADLELARAQERIRSRRWYANNKERAALGSAVRRVRERLVDTRLVTDREWLRLVLRYQGLCAYCQERPWAERDHIVPLVKGGRHSIGNLLPVCGTCNRSKGSRLLVEWRQACGR